MTSSALDALHHELPRMNTPDAPSQTHGSAAAPGRGSSITGDPPQAEAPAIRETHLGFDAGSDEDGHVSSLVPVGSTGSLVRAASESNGSGSKGAPSLNRTLYLGNLHPFVNDIQLREVFDGLEGITELKVIKDKATGMSAGYGFAKFSSNEFAAVALDCVASTSFLGQEMRVNWAFQKSDDDDSAPGHAHIFVGDLAPDVTDAILLSSFQSCEGCTDARVQWDTATGRSRGYGFVTFATQEEAEAAIHAMHGQSLHSRRIRCGWAQHKTDVGLPMDARVLDRVDPTNTNVYVGNLSSTVSDTDLRRHFLSFGPVVEVKLHRKGAFGFVRYKVHDDAVKAIFSMNGTSLGGKVLKCSWGRHPVGSAIGAAPANVLLTTAAMPSMSMPMGGMGPTPLGANYMGAGMMGVPMTSVAARNALMQGQGMHLSGGRSGLRNENIVMGGGHNGLGMHGGLGMGVGHGGIMMDPSRVYPTAGYSIAAHNGLTGQLYFANQPNQ